MATPAYLNSAQASETDGDSSVTLSFTANAGSNRMVEVTVCVGASSPDQPTGVTWGGVAMTSRGAANVGGSGRISKWRIMEASFPGSATGNVVASFSGGMDELWIVAAAYSTVSQATPYRNVSITTNSAANSNAPTVTISSNSDDLCTASAWGLDGGAQVQSITVNAGTSRQEVDNFASLGYEAGGVGEIAGATPTQSWTFVVAGGGDTMDDWTMLGDSLQGAGGGGGGIKIPVIDRQFRQRRS